MITDSFEINGKEIDIHIIENTGDNYFSIVAKGQGEEMLNGFEFRVKRIPGVDIDAFSQGAPAFAIISFMRRQIEESHWQVYEEDAFEAPFHQQRAQDSPREQGRKAFMEKRHYRYNPYSGLDVFSHDDWDQGWAEAAQKNPHLFDFETDTFQD